MVRTDYEIKKCGCYFSGETKRYCLKHDPTRIKTIFNETKKSSNTQHDKTHSAFNDDRSNFYTQHESRVSRVTSNDKRFKLYVLYLEDDKYYIGMTSNVNPKNRINMHGTLMGAQWTLLHRPIEIIDIIDLGFVSKEEAERKENDLTLAYMREYGMQNVRGGYMTKTGILLMKRYTPGSWQYYISSVVEILPIILMIVLGIYLLKVNN